MSRVYSRVSGWKTSAYNVGGSIVCEYMSNSNATSRLLTDLRRRQVDTRLDRSPRLGRLRWRFDAFVLCRLQLRRVRPPPRTLRRHEVAFEVDGGVQGGHNVGDNVHLVDTLHLGRELVWKEVCEGGRTHQQVQVTLIPPLALKDFAVAGLRQVG